MEVDESASDRVKDFEYAAFGKRIATARFLSGSKIRSVGFTLADKQAGPFRLEVAWIRAEKVTPADASKAGKQADGSAGAKDIVDTAVSAGQFKTLVTAVKSAGLVEALKGKGPLTVFAPNDDAFAKLPKGTVEELLKPKNRDRLKAVLTYHVVPGKILLGARSLTTLEGRTLAISAPGSIEINGARVIASNIVASNGVVHVIDRVLIPPTRKLTPPEAARAVIELAIQRGVPLFNAGNHAACAAVYEIAIEALLKSPTDALTDKDRSTFRKALGRMRDQKNQRQQAWTLRRALDAVYESLAGD